MTTPTDTLFLKPERLYNLDTSTRLTSETHGPHYITSCHAKATANGQARSYGLDCPGGTAMYPSKRSAMRC